MPSGGPGPSVLTDPGGGTGPSGALVSTSGGPGSSASGSSSGGPAQTTQQAQGAAAPSQAVVNYLNQMLSKLFPGGPGYPLPPSVGPTQTGTLLDPNIMAALPVSVQESAVAVVPLMLYGGDTSVISTVTPPAGYTAMVVTVTSGSDTAMYLVVMPVSTPSTTAPASGATASSSGPTSSNSGAPVNAPAPGATGSTPSTSAPTSGAPATS